MPNYTHLFFDLDHTLWDFERCSEETLAELYLSYSLAQWTGTPESAFIAAFREVNFAMWDQYNRGLIDKDTIRNTRFSQVFGKLGIPAEKLPPSIGDEYLYLCPQKPYLLEGCLETLQYLHPTYRLHILTNGFEEVQHIKLHSSGIAHFFECIITSECTGFKKPQPEIFYHALQRAGAALHQSLMIGDNPETDMGGALGVNMHCVFYNPQKTPHTLPVHFEIDSLTQLKGFL
jgi:putative hydrolase of the HAD superfamily